MKKIILGVLAAAFAWCALPQEVSAAQAEQVAFVTPVAKTSSTCEGFVISNTAATSVIKDTTLKYHAVAVQNDEGVYSIFCSDRSDVTVRGNLRGWRIKPTKWAAWLVPHFSDWYCITDSTGSAGATVCRGK